MPELPDVTTYITCLRPRVVGRRLCRAIVRSPFLLRTVDPPLQALDARRVEAVERIGKRMVLALEDDLFAIIHLMIAGRFRWHDAPDRRPTGRNDLAAFQFDSGTLLLTEAATKKRAALHLCAGRDSLRPFDRGGLDVMHATAADFAARLRSENHTLKRALTDPRLLDGIGNAYADEILHAARLSPVMLTGRISDEQAARLHAAARQVLGDWIDRLGKQFGRRFPKPGEITAFRPEFAAHGKYGRPCPICRTPIQRIRYAERETNYCPTCQTGDKVLADRSLSRLLKSDWPRTAEELEESGGARR